MKPADFKVLILLPFFCFISDLATAQYPEARISNRILDAHVYLPDPNTGFYRGTRFDWAGVISSLKFKGHEYFGQWYANHNPLTHDAIQGPAEIFDPIGYDAAQPGQTFLKIGVGTLKKVNNAPYRFSTRFEIDNGGVWKTVPKKDRVEFVQELRDSSGYAYIYKKVLRLSKNKPELILEHSLKNTGRKTLETNTFNHNFFMIDKDTTGPVFTVTLPYEISSQPAGKLMSFSGKEMKYLKTLSRGESTMEYPKDASGSSSGNYEFRIENNKTGAGVLITADQPLASFMYWSVPTTLSPEPFIHIKAEPGKTAKWKISYEFYEKR